MRKSVLFSTILLAVPFAVPVHAVELSSDSMRTVQQYSGNARLKLAAGDRFSVSSDHSLKTGDATIYAGSVTVALTGMTLETEFLVIEKQPDGSALLRGESFLLSQP